MLKGKQLVYCMILVILCGGETTGARHRRSHRRRAAGICNDGGFQSSLQFTLDSANNITHNLNCRLDPALCSDNKIYNYGRGDTPAIPVVCNAEFLNATFKFLKTSYKNVTDIRHMIDRLVFFSDDELEKLTNLLLNWIRVTMAIIKPDYDVITMTSPQQTGHNLSDTESGMVVTYTRTVGRIESYLKTALCIIKKT